MILRNRAVWRGVFVLVAVCLSRTGPVCAQTKPQQDLREHLERFAELTADVNSLSADFEQQRHTPLLKKPIRSSGRLRIVGGLSRWDTAEPFSSSMLITDDRLSLYYPDAQTVEVYPLASRLAELSASPVPSLKIWDKHFSIERTSAGELPERLRPALTRAPAEEDDEANAGEREASQFLIQLTPKDEELKAYLSALYVQIDPQTGLCRAVGWAGRDGEWTAIVFTGVKANAEIDRAALRLNPPEGTKVVYPLGPVEPPEKKAD